MNDKPERLTASVTIKLIFILVVFLGVPLLIYNRFAEGDEQRRRLLLENLQLQGKLAASTLRQELAGADENAPQEVQKLIDTLPYSRIHVRLLLRPRGSQDTVLAASAPSFSAADSVTLTHNLLQREEIENAIAACAGALDEIVPITMPDRREELILSLSPIATNHGCWLVLISVAASDPELINLVRPFLSTAEVQFAILIYIVMALIALWIGISIWISLWRFGRLARELSKGSSVENAKFVELTPVRELQPIAAAIDHLVETMRHAAEAIRESSEENAHAFKGAVATIRQAMEPLRAEHSAHREKAIETIEHSLAKLDGLIAAAKRSEQDLAASISEGRHPINFTGLVENSVRAFTENLLPSNGLILECYAEQGLYVLANEEALETIVENLLDNAIDFAPLRSKVAVRLTKSGNQARLTIEDQGPGVAPELLASIFNRHFSTRLSNPTHSGPPHFGLGLAIVRRNTAMMGGTVFAENVKPTGFRVTIDLPLHASRK